MAITQRFLCDRDDGPLYLFTLTDETGSIVEMINFGCAIISIKVPSRTGELVDVTPGFNDPKLYFDQKCGFGVICGRYANRIAKGRFTLNGKEYQLFCNNGENHLHGGKVGFSKKLWTPEINGDTLIMRYTSPDMEEGYPGTLYAQVSFTLKNASLIIERHCTSDADTIVNLANHSYFNLSGHNSGTVYDQRLTIHASRYCEIDAGCLPTKAPVPVEGTPFDFRTPHTIGERIHDDNEQLHFGKDGYDHNFVLDHAPGEMALAVTMESDKTGIRLNVHTDMPGIQFYAANTLNAENGKENTHYQRGWGACFEAQNFPNAINVPGYPSPILRKGEVYTGTSIYEFTTF